MNSYPDCFTESGKFKGESYHVEAGTSIPPRKTPCRPVLTHQQAAFQQQLADMQAVYIFNPVDQLMNSFVIANKKQLDKYGKLQLYICSDSCNVKQVIARHSF